MKHLCLDARLLGFSGIGTYLKQLIPRLDKTRWDLTLIVFPSARETFPFLDPFRLIETSLPVFSPFEQIRLPFLIPACDLFWSPHANAPLFPTRAKRTLMTLHDAYHARYIATLSPLQALYVRQVLPRIVRRVDHVITVSHFSAREIEHFFAPKALSVIYNGIDTARFQIDSSSNVQGHHPLNLPYFLFVGLHKPHKNLQRLLQAVSRLLDETDRPFQLVIVGSKKGLRTSVDLKEMIGDRLAPFVRILEHVADDELPSLYRQAVGLVFPSLYEGFGLPPLEAMSSGCPVIASGTSSLPEICGEAALLIDPQDPLSIAHAMKRLLEESDLREALIAKGALRAAEFSWDRSAEEHMGLLEKIFYTNTP